VKKIARGGFSSVYQAKHKVDLQTYAIKKIVLKVNGKNEEQIQERLEKLLKEVRLFAAINDSHIVRYNHSWLEVTELEPELSEVKTASSSPVQEIIEPDINLVSPYIDFEQPNPSEYSKEPQQISLEKQPPQSNLSQKYELKITLYIQMELCKQTLETCLEELNSLHPKITDSIGFNKRLFIAGQILDSIYTLHKIYGLIHRDISLRNIFINNDGTVKLGDFGLATKCQHIIPIESSPFSIGPIQTPALVEELTSLNLDGSSSSNCHSDKNSMTSGLGTQTFSAPEQLSGYNYDQSADIYSLGLIFLTLFCPTSTNSERFENIKNVRNFLQIPTELNKNLPELANLIIKMTSKNPLERPNISTIINNEIFSKYTAKRKLSRAKSGSIKIFENKIQKFESSLGLDGKWKTRYVKLTENMDKLLVFNKKEEQKARYCYPLSECRITKNEGNLAIIEHKDLETLVLKLENEIQSDLVSQLI